MCVCVRVRVCVCVRVHVWVWVWVCAHVTVYTLVTAYRSVGETNMNDRSSRSHTIFTLTVESRLRGEDERDCTVKVGSLVRDSMQYTFCMYMYMPAGIQCRQLCLVW